jgi:hypothetical protein
MSPSVDKEKVVNRARELLAVCENAGMNPNQISEAYYGALNLLRVVQGSGSVQEQELIAAVSTANKPRSGNHGFNLRHYVAPAVQGALKSLIADIEAGLTGNIAMQVSGEVLGDLLGLAREALDTEGESQQKVAAVLVAAAFEDTLRRLAETKAGITDRPKLDVVVDRLKTAGVLVGVTVSNAKGFIKFRNDSLHADWKNVREPTISSCLAFVEGLLREHFV